MVDRVDRDVLASRLTLRCSEEFRRYLKVFTAAKGITYRELILRALANQYVELVPWVEGELKLEEDSLVETEVEASKDELETYRGSYDQ